MALCQWSESMSVGESRLDADHKALIRLINRLHESLEAGVEPAALGEVFDSLINYTRFHFTREVAIGSVRSVTSEAWIFGKQSST